MRWTASDFAAAAILLAAVGGAAELAVRGSRDTAYRAGAGVAIAAAFLTVWVALAVGIVGAEGHPGNLMFLGMLLIGLIGAVAARLRPLGLARAALATALATALAAVGALVAWPDAASPLALVFAALWLGAAWLFFRAARRARRGSALAE